MAQSLAALADDLRCSICLGTLKQPKVLPCCHTFCKGCLSKLPVMRKPEDELSVRGEPPSTCKAQGPGSTSEPEHTSDAEEKTAESDFSDDSEPSVVPEEDNDSLTLDIDPSDGDFLFVDFITCPQCRAEHKVSGSSSVDGFLTDYTSESQLREQSSSSKSEKDLRCDGCDNLDPAVAFCSDCLERLCDFCSNAHKRLKRFARHNVKQLMDLDDTEFLSLNPRAVHVCAHHPGEPVQLYCEQCDTVVCNKCITSSEHRSHEFSEISSKTRKEVDEKLTSLSTTVDKKLRIQVENLKYVTRVEKATSNMATDIQQKISQTFDSYEAELKARREGLLEESETKCNAKMKVLWSERDSLERTIADMTTTQNFTSRVRNCRNDTEFLQLTSQVLPRLRKLDSVEWDNDVVEDIEHYSLDFDESNLDVDLISEAGNFNENQLSQYNVEYREFGEEAHLGVEQSFSIHITKGKCCRSWTHIDTPSVTLKHVESATCDVADVSITCDDSIGSVGLLEFDSFNSMNNEEKWDVTNVWIVTYTPYCGGRHTLTVTVGDETSERDIIVIGTPPVGSNVMRGPSHYGVVDGKVLSFNQHLKQVSVEVDARNARGVYYGYKIARQFSWGRNDEYDIQLKH